MLQDNDVVLVDAETHRERTRFLGDASDLWTLVRWNGFRPRAKGLDVPVNFDADSDTTAIDNPATDSARAALAAAANGGGGIGRAPARGGARTAWRPTTPPIAPPTAAPVSAR